MTGTTLSGKYDLARALVEQIIANCANPVVPKTLLASIEAALGNVAEGEDILKKVLRDVNDDEFTHTCILGCRMDYYWRLGMEKKASKVMKKINRSSFFPPTAHSQVPFYR